MFVISQQAGIVGTNSLIKKIQFHGDQFVPMHQQPDSCQHVLKLTLKLQNLET
jgi:hypothetical protein